MIVSAEAAYRQKSRNRSAASLVSRRPQSHTLQPSAPNHLRAKAGKTGATEMLHGADYFGERRRCVTCREGRNLRLAYFVPDASRLPAQASDLVGLAPVAGLLPVSRTLPIVVVYG
jgi:hypothetical protein